MELLIYLIVYFLTIWFIFFPKSLSSKSFFIFWILTAICLSLIIRSSIGETDSGDIDGYIKYMAEIPGENVSLNYMLREFIFWFGIIFLFTIIGDGAAVFVILDFLLFLFIYKGFTLCQKAYYPQIDQRNIHYLFFAVLLFFPYVMGMHNVYRQILASSIFLVSLGLIGNKKPIRGYLTSLISVFIHNASGMFLPLLMVSTKNKMFQYSSFIILIPIIFVTTGISDSSSDFAAREGSIEIGKTIKYMYLISLGLLLSTLIFIELKAKERNNSTFVSLFSILFILYIGNVFFISSEQAQRIIFYIFSMLFPFFGYFFFITFKPRIIASLVFFHLSLLPLVLIYNSAIDISL